jgi:hypothetical protein
MLRHAYEVLEQAACTLARSAQPIQQRLNVASSIIGQLRPEDFGASRDLADIFARLAGLMHRQDSAGGETQLDFSALCDERAEQLAADVFNVFVDVARIHLSTRH